MILNYYNNGQRVHIISSYKKYSSYKTFLPTKFEKLFKRDTNYSFCLAVQEFSLFIGMCLLRVKRTFSANFLYVVSFPP